MPFRTNLLSNWCILLHLILVTSLMEKILGSKLNLYICSRYSSHGSQLKTNLYPTQRRLYKSSTQEARLLIMCSGLAKFRLPLNLLRCVSWPSCDNFELTPKSINVNLSEPLWSNLAQIFSCLISPCEKPKSCILLRAGTIYFIISTANHILYFFENAY